ncbi:pE199L [African swine fever virus]|uniref:Inner membrane protein E199L n=2 Tax=African swine fever virus TaxID=10497 RepID=VF199_ASFB7|nr:pE199L [African swine fever virus]YP_009702534.1 pE199L [African swine fever virus]Q65198.1 RecName: Full=Inner membrane protein E199L; Short=pE199L [African swine fever virus BA71V]AAA65358.1 pE199L [African swine fever virus]AKO62810.1 pE199L [African swine fever virus]WNK22232.1 pE199L [African swine fever virus]WOK21684.1 E199L [African swine fever virus]WOK21826.1 E199L [African swine fever virus]
MSCMPVSTKCNDIWVDFSCTGPSISELQKKEPKAWAAILRSHTNQQTAEDDNIIGSICDKQGLCSKDEYAYSQYCACVNSGTLWAECAFAPCNGNKNAYKTTEHRNILTNKQCPSGLTICQNIAEYGGSGNISDLYQNFNCNSVINTFLINVMNHPFLTLILIILILIIIYRLMPSSGGKHNDDKLPPPSLIFSNLNNF